MEQTLEQPGEQIKGQSETIEVAKEPSAIEAKLKELHAEINKLVEEYHGENAMAENIIDLKADLITAFEKIKSLLDKKYPAGAEISEDEQKKISDEIAKEFQEWVTPTNRSIIEAEAKLAESKK